MATVIFIHGTSVRRNGYKASLAKIEKGLTESLKRANRAPVEVADCLWGDSLGARLNMEGLSIPNYHDSGGKAKAFSAEEDQILLWEMLGFDPLFELHGLALRSRRQIPMFDHDQFTTVVNALPPADLSAKLTEAGVDPTVFTASRDYVLNHPVYQDMLLTAAGRGECRLPLARAILAEALARLPDEPPPSAATDPAVRDSLVTAAANAIAPADMAAVSWVVNKLYGLAQAIGSTTLQVGREVCVRAVTPLAKWKRGKLTDSAVPGAGDILLYQAKGQAIRDFIRDKVKKSRPPVVLLAHSLGGIACVDLLIREHLPEVATLVTVGSQAPFLYELNALASLDYGQPLPSTFVKRWVNIYDPRDFLSYQAAKVFASPVRDGPTIVDHRVDNKLPFPNAHGGYWDNAETWMIVAGEVPAS
jgi:hypothetical protein